MTVTYDSTDLSTTLAQVRLNIGDVDTTTTAGARSTWTVIFTDEEIQSFITRAGSDVNLSSAYALRAIAASRAMMAKMVKIGDYTQDLRQLAKELRDSADAYEKAAGETPSIDYAEQAVTDFAARDIIWNRDLRSG